MISFFRFALFISFLATALILSVKAKIEWSAANYAFPDFEIKNVLAYAKFHRSIFGCTYVVTHLKSNPGNPPYFVRTAFGDTVDKNGWKATPDPLHKKPGDGDYGMSDTCTNGSARKDGSDLGGYAEIFVDLLTSEGAFYTHISEHLFLVHPTRRIAVRLRYGD